MAYYCDTVRLTVIVEAAQQVIGSHDRARSNKLPPYAQISSTAKRTWFCTSESLELPTLLKEDNNSTQSSAVHVPNPDYVSKAAACSIGLTWTHYKPASSIQKS
eukprot:GHUV01018537.1.p2 GENE.GHUV01018537.1~~GHUV01018537.1.p2  ORF type:complete len:104 (-),score=21.86 GHUV01018537.1:850-1161(-)